MSADESQRVDRGRRKFLVFSFGHRAEVCTVLST